MSQSISILARARNRLREIARDNQLLDADVTVRVRPVPAEEATGSPGRSEFPILDADERVLEATVRGTHGHAHTGTPREFAGTLDEVLGLPLDSNTNRAIFLAALNATLRHLGLINGKVHCEDRDPEHCACEMAEQLRQRYGQVEQGLLGVNPVMARRLVDLFGPEPVEPKPAAPTGSDRRPQSGAASGSSEVVLLTGNALVDGTFDEIYEQIRLHNKRYLVHGVTAAGVAALLDLKRVCPRGRDG